jgi:hypothetical protein
MIHYDSSGFPINATGLYYKKTQFEGGEPQLYGNGKDIAILFAAGVLKIRNNPNGDWRGIQAASYAVMSGTAFKRNIRNLDEEDSLAVLRGAKPRRYRWHTDDDDQPDRLGLIAEELPHPVRTTIVSTPTDPDEHDEIVSEAYDITGALAVLWDAVRAIDGRVSDIEDPRRRPRK